MQMSIACMLLMVLCLGYHFKYIGLIYICGWFGYDAIKFIFQQGEKFIPSFLWNLCILWYYWLPFKLLYSSWKLDSAGMVGSSVWLFLMLSCDFSVLIHDTLLTLVLSISLGSNAGNTVAVGVWLSIVCSVLSNNGYLWFNCDQMLNE